MYTSFYCMHRHINIIYQLHTRPLIRIIESPSILIPALALCNPSKRDLKKKKVKK
jgi:hypothetical protein